jgi:hypothetical protein
MLPQLVQHLFPRLVQKFGWVEGQTHWQLALRICPPVHAVMHWLVLGQTTSVPGHSH